MDQRPVGSAPWTLIDYFPDDYLLIIDESHMAIPQVRGMYKGDRQRKQTLVDYGFRLPSALDNRPLNFDEFNKRVGQIIYASATPAAYEREVSERIVQQVIRPTGILDPQIHIRPVLGQVDDLVQEVALRVKRKERALIITLTQRMSEELAGYLNEIGIKAQYLHAEINTLERIEILRDLRMGIYDVVVGINLLREGLDLPEVALVAILDADKEGFLRSESALIQTIGRAARHVDGQVIMYADRETPSMKRAFQETYRRREIQQAHNETHGIIPRGIVKSVQDLTDRVRTMISDDEETVTPDNDDGRYNAAVLHKLSTRDIHAIITQLQDEMKAEAQALRFEQAAALRDQIIELRSAMAEKSGVAD